MTSKEKAKDPFHLTDNEIDLLCIQTGTYSKHDNDEIKQQWKKKYRKAEEESNKMIDKYGSVEKWYQSGEGRIL
jgi:hypothetical protein